MLSIYFQKGRKRRVPGFLKKIQLGRGRRWKGRGVGVGGVR